MDRRQNNQHRDFGRRREQHGSHYQSGGYGQNRDHSMRGHRQEAGHHSQHHRPQEHHQFRSTKYGDHRYDHQKENMHPRYSMNGRQDAQHNRGPNKGTSQIIHQSSSCKSNKKFNQKVDEMSVGSACKLVKSLLPDFRYDQNNFD